ncbi:MAG TPA: HEAT repeat domain-containing protein [Streptosporangiaceae bacterium]|nr:HEAT repeat domain-containing protein [Streptosporangiaceae bacterium]
MAGTGAGPASVTLPSGTDFDGTRDAYLQWVRRRYDTVDHIATLSGDSVEFLQLRLPDIFVPLQVRAAPPPVELPRELWLRYLTSGKTSEHDLPRGMEKHLLDRKLRTYADRPVRQVLEVLSAPEGQRLVLLGYPGAGKSTLARYVALTLAAMADGHSQGGNSEPLARLAGYLPFVVELRTYAEHASPRSFLDVIAAMAGDGFAAPLKPLIESCLTDRGQAVVIFDGLDEVFDGKLRTEAKRRIRDFAQFYPGVRVIVTSRVTDYDRHELDKGEFAHHTIQDLDAPAVATFAHLFYDAVCAGDPSEAERLTARLLRAVNQATDVAELAGNPMLLTSIAFLGRGQPLPRSRLEALERTVKLLAEGWDVGRHLRRERGDRQIEPVATREKLELLRLVARRIVAGADGREARNYLPGAQLALEFAGYFRARYEVSEGEAENIAWRLLDQLRARDYILARFETDAYGFMHRAFLDYLAADDLLVQFSTHKLDEAGIVAVFRAHWQEPAWQEVLPLLAGLLEPEVAEPAILALLQARPLWYLDPDPLPRHVLLAIRCLGEVRWLHPFRTVSRALATALASLFETVSERTDYGLGVTLAQALERDALPILAELGAGWAGRPLYETWYLTRGQFLRGERPGFAQNVAAAIYVALLGRDDDARRRLASLARWAGNETVRAAALQSMAANWPTDPDTARVLHSSVTGDPEWYVRRDAVRACAVRAGAARLSGDAAMRDLMIAGALHDEVPEVRSAAVQALAARWPDGDTLALLRILVTGEPGREKDSQVRAAAVRAVADGWRDDPETLPWLWRCAADGASPRVQAAVAEALAAGWRDQPGALDWLQRHATSARARHPEVQIAALRALAAGWPERQDTREILQTQACAGSSADPDVRRAAVEALAVGWHDRETARWLRQRAVEEPDEEVRYAATQALAAYWLGEEDDEAETVRVLEHLIRQDADPFVTAAAIQAIARLRAGDMETGQRLRLLASHDQSWYVRLTALRAVVTGYRDAAGTTDLLRERAAADRDADVRCAAVRALALGWHDDPEVLSWLRTAGTGETRSADVSRVSTQVVATVWRDDAATLAWLQERTAGDQRPDVRRVSLQLLAADVGWHAMPGVVDLLRHIAVSDSSAAVRRTAIRVLSAGWQDELQTCAWLRDQAFEANEPSAKVAVIRALATDWHDDPQTPGWLRARGAADDDPVVRHAAEDALALGWPELTPAGRV